jgi:intracellular sulfur oxidation DsrE/DsrF family protein
MWTRRTLSRLGFLVACFGGEAAFAGAARSKALNAVYHLDDQDKVAFVLGNIHNHYAGIGDDTVKIALIVHGGAIRAFRTTSAPSDVETAFGDLVQDNGLQAFACSNSLQGEGIKLKDLFAGFQVAERGGVVKLAELQGQGYAYIRP